MVAAHDVRFIKEGACTRVPLCCGDGCVGALHDEEYGGCSPAYEGKDEGDGRISDLEEEEEGESLHLDEIEDGGSLHLDEVVNEEDMDVVEDSGKWIQ